MNKEEQSVCVDSSLSMQKLENLKIFRHLLVGCCASIICGVVEMVRVHYHIRVGLPVSLRCYGKRIER